MSVQLEHFNLTRRVFTRLARNFEAQQLDYQPKALNNTLRWHLGHCIVIPEHYLFHFPDESEHVPAHYYGMFAADTSPADWQQKPPSHEELIAHIEKQTERINGLDSCLFDKPLQYDLPFGRFKTYEDIFSFMIHHEAEHIGQMKTMLHYIDYEMKQRI